MAIWAHISRGLVSHGDAAEHDGVTVVLGGRARLTHTLQQLAHGTVLPLAHQPLAGTLVHGQCLQLEVLKKQKREREGGREGLCGRM